MKIGLLHNDNMSDFRGSTIQSWQLFKHLRKKHTIYTLKSCQFPGAIKSYGRFWDAFRYVRSIDVLLVIIDGSFNFSLEKMGMIAAIFNANIPVVWYINAPCEEAQLSGNIKPIYMYSIIRRFFARFVTAAICVSEDISNYAKRELGIEHTLIIPNGSDVNKFSPKKKFPKTYIHTIKDKFIVLWAGDGRYRWQAIDVIVKTAALMEKTRSDVVFFILSDNLWIKQPVPSNVCVMPYQSYNIIPRYIHAADICLCLYHSHRNLPFYNSPMKLFDYMAMQKPVIASPLGQIRKIIHHNENGIFVNNSPKSLSREIIRLIKNSKLRSLLGREARKTIIVHKYTWKNVSVQIETLLEKLRH